MSVKFTRTNTDYYTIPSFNPSYLTITAWINSTQSYGDTFGGHQICSKDNDYTRCWQFRFGYGSPATNSPQFIVWNTSGSIAFASHTTTVSANTWNFVACRFDGSNACVWLNTSKVVGDALSGSIRTGAIAILVGENASGTYPGKFDGRIADLRVFNSALTDNEILNIYASRGKAYESASQRWFPMIESYPTAAASTVKNIRDNTTISASGSPAFSDTVVSYRKRR